jgi:hypothetical protein
VQIFGLLTEWSLLVVALPTTILGLFMVSDEVKAFKAARVFFWLSAVWMWGKIMWWSAQTTDSFYSRSAAVFIACGLIAVGLTEALRLTTRREVHHTAEEGQSTNEKADEIKPNFTISVTDSVNTYAPDKDQTMMFIGAQFLNRGASSAVIFHRPHYKAPSLDSDVNMLNLSQSRAIVFPSENKTLIVKHSNLITTKVANGLSKGQSVTGRLAIGIPGDRLKEIANGVSVTLTIEDFTGKQYPVTYQTDPLRPPARLLIAEDEEVESRSRSIGYPPAGSRSQAAVTFTTYVQPDEPYVEGTLLAGIVWQKQYVDVRVDIANVAIAISNLDLLVDLDTSIAGVGQISQFPGFTAFPDSSPPPAWLQGTDSQGKPVSVPMVPMPGTMNTAPIYRVHCSSVFANTVIHLVIASIALNQAENGALPQQLFAPRRSPRLIKIKGTYETTHGSSIETHNLQFSYEFKRSS